MWIRTKEEAVTLIRKMKASIPDVRAEKIEHERFFMNLPLMFADLKTAIGKLPSHIETELETIVKSDYKHDGTVPLTFSDTPQQWTYWRYEGLKDFFTLLEEWVVQGFERGMYPVAPKQQPQKIESKGWWFFGNGVRSVLMIQGKEIPLEGSASGKGRGYPIILMQLLSWPRTTIVTEPLFGEAVRSRWGVEDADTDAYKPRAFTDAIRDLNKSIKDVLHTEEEFIVKNGTGYSVNQKFL